VGVAHQRVHQHCRYLPVSEATGQRQLHHLGAVALTQLSRFPIPEVDSTKIRWNIAPIAIFVTGRVDNLNKPDGTPLNLSNQLLSPVGDTTQKDRR